LTNIDLVEVSIVTFPANPKARVSSVKTFTVEELRDLEDSLRDAGLSRTDAKSALSIFRRFQRDAGMPGLTHRDDAVPEPTASAAHAMQAADELLARICGGALKF